MIWNFARLTAYVIKPVRLRVMKLQAIVSASIHTLVTHAVTVRKATPRIRRLESAVLGRCVKLKVERSTVMVMEVAGSRVAQQFAHVHQVSRMMD